MFFIRIRSAAMSCSMGLSILILTSGCTFKPIKAPEQPGSALKTHSEKAGEPQQKQAAEKQGKAEAKPDIAFFKSAIEQPLSPDNTEELLDEVGSNWLYGQGIGETAVTVGAIVVFPPYALWVIGNTALQLSGEEPVEVSNMLPEEGGEIWRATYDGITSVPGQTTAAIAGEDFRSKEVARERIEAVLEKNSKEHKDKKYEKPWTSN